MLSPLEREAFEHGYKILVTMAEGMANEYRKGGRPDLAATMTAFANKARVALPEFAGMVNEDNMAAVLWYVEKACGVNGGADV